MASTVCARVTASSVCRDRLRENGGARGDGALGALILIHGGRERIVAPDRGEILEFGMNCAGGVRRPRIGSVHEVIEDVVRADV